MTEIQVALIVASGPTMAVIVSHWLRARLAKKLAKDNLKIQLEAHKDHEDISKQTHEMILKSLNGQIDEGIWRKEGRGT